MPFGADARGRLAVLPAFVLVVPFQCSLVGPARGLAPIAPSAAPSSQLEPPAPPPSPPPRAEPVGPSAASPKQEEPAPRIPSAPPPPAVRAVALPAAAVVSVMAAGQQSFRFCWTHAQRSDAPPSSTKVRLHLEIDDQGRVTAVRSDTDSPALERCVGRVARGLAFPAPGQPAVVDVPLMFR